MSEKTKELFRDFTATAWMLMAVGTVGVLLSSATHMAVRLPWPQLLFMDVFRNPGLALLTVLLAPQPLFSPVTVAVLASCLPLGFHLLALGLLWTLTRSWALKARIFYMFTASVPVFGPIAAQSLMKNLGDLND